MTRSLYLIAILVSAAGIVVLDRQLAVGIVSGRLVRAIAMTVPLFLAFDLLGAARGWFSSNPRFNLLIVPPGVPLEEPFLLAFLTLVSVALLRGAQRVLR